MTSQTKKQLILILITHKGNQKIFFIIVYCFGPIFSVLQWSLLLYRGKVLSFISLLPFDLYFLNICRSCSSSNCYVKKFVSINVFGVIAPFFKFCLLCQKLIFNPNREKNRTEINKFKKLI